MVLLSPPKIDNIQLLDDIISNKKTGRRKKLQQYRDQVIDRYNFFASHSLDEIKPLDAAIWRDVKDDLHSCYENKKNVAFSNVRKKLMTLTTRCPYCTLNRCNTLDHYFDKSSYPEFSVYSPNLIPCCPECNNIKGTVLFNDVGTRQFIHFYFDKAPDFQYLFARFTIDPNDRIPRVDVSLCFGNHHEYEEQIQTHYKKLNLLQKYQEAIIDYLPVDLDLYRRHKEKGMTNDKIREVIEDTSLVHSNSFGYNYWKTCMYEGILNSDGFLDGLFSVQ